MMQLNPLEAAMGRLLDSLFAKDEYEIFNEPVEIEDVPDYMDVVTHPMDLGTMRKKLNSGSYQTLDDMENDFNLMISNCLAYNNKGTIYYRAGVSMRDKCSSLFKSTRKELIRSGIVDEPQSDESLAHEVDVEVASLIEQKLTTDELIAKLQALMEKAMRIKHGTKRGKRAKMIRVELMKAKKVSNKIGSSPMKANSAATVATASVVASDSSQSEDEDMAGKDDAAAIIQSTPPCSPQKSINQASPSGVNRRTAVLFTRKAQAAASMKKPELLAPNEEASTDQNIVGSNSILMASTGSPGDVVKTKSPKKGGRARRCDSLNSEQGASVATTLTASGFLDVKANSSQVVLNAGPSTCGSSHRKSSPVKERYVPSVPDSFRTYRGGMREQSSDSDDSHIDYSDSSCSSCSEESASEFG